MKKMEKYNRSDDRGVKNGSQNTTKYKNIKNP